MPEIDSITGQVYGTLPEPPIGSGGPLADGSIRAEDLIALQQGAQGGPAAPYPPPAPPPAPPQVDTARAWYGYAQQTEMENARLKRELESITPEVQQFRQFRETISKPEFKQRFEQAWEATRATPPPAAPPPAAPPPASAPQQGAPPTSQPVVQVQLPPEFMQVMHQSAQTTQAVQLWMEQQQTERQSALLDRKLSAMKQQYGQFDEGVVLDLSQRLTDRSGRPLVNAVDDLDKVMAYYNQIRYGVGVPQQQQQQVPQPQNYPPQQGYPQQGGYAPQQPAYNQYAPPPQARPPVGTVVPPPTRSSIAPQAPPEAIPQGGFRGNGDRRNAAFAYLSRLESQGRG